MYSMRVFNDARDWLALGNFYQVTSVGSIFALDFVIRFLGNFKLCVQGIFYVGISNVAFDS